MAQCSLCNNPAVIDNPLFCKEHFTIDFENRVFATIKEYNLIKESSKVAVAVSGGKDSLTVLTILNKQYPVTAILIDEGIADYRDHTIEDMKRVCADKKIPYKIYSFKEYSGMTLNEMIQNGTSHPCSTCGTMRRQLLNIASKEFDIIATGHNADDESQAILMNIIRGNTEIFPRLGPSSGIHEHKEFVQRIKPLYFCTEKEIMTYAYLHNLIRGYNECPHAGKSYRSIVRDELNNYAQSHPAARKTLLKQFLNFKSGLRVEQIPILKCTSCGEPSSSKVCRACLLLENIKINKH